jgi:hypothetical protein
MIAGVEAIGRRSLVVLMILMARRKLGSLRGLSASRQRARRYALDAADEQRDHHDGKPTHPI